MRSTRKLLGVLSFQTGRWHNRSTVRVVQAFSSSVPETCFLTLLYKTPSSPVFRFFVRFLPRHETAYSDTEWIWRGRVFHLGHFPSPLLLLCEQMSSCEGDALALMCGGISFVIQLLCQAVVEVYFDSQTHLPATWVRGKLCCENADLGWNFYFLFIDSGIVHFSVGSW